VGTIEDVRPLLCDAARAEAANTGTGAAIAAARDKVPCSLEFDLFPALTASDRCFVFPAERPLVDIGTPEQLKAANDLLG